MTSIEAAHGSIQPSKFTRSRGSFTSTLVMLTLIQIVSFTGIGYAEGSRVDDVPEMVAVLNEADMLALAPVGASHDDDADDTNIAPPWPKLYDPDKAIGKRVKVGGYLQAHHMTEFNDDGDKGNEINRFRVLRVRLTAEGDVTNHFAYELDIDPRAPLHEGLLRDAFITVNRFVPFHKVRLGQQKVQFGYENMISSTNLFVVNRTEYSDAIARGINLRDIGISFIGAIPICDGLIFEDAVSLTNGAGINKPENNRSKNVSGRIGLRYDVPDSGWKFRFGASGSHGDIIDDEEEIHFDRFGLDFEVDHPWFTFASEYGMGYEDFREAPDPKENNDPYGYYVQIAGKSPWKVGPIFRYGRYNDDIGGDKERYTAGLYYGNPDDPFRVLLNYENRVEEDNEKADDRLYIQAQLRY